MTKIEWTHRPGTTGETWNPIRARNTKTGKIGWHCEKIAEGCDGCYAADLNERLGDSGGTGFPYKPGHLKNGDIEVYLDEKVLLKPLHWHKPRTIFVCSMTDLFAGFVPDEWIDKVFAIAALCPQHTFIILTKRPARMRLYVTGGGIVNRAHIIWQAMYGEAKTPDAGHVLDSYYGGPNSKQWPLQNVWLGTSAENQRRADERIPHLLATPAAIRFVSCEPMLGAIDLTRIGSIDTLRDTMPDVVKKFERGARPSTLSGMQIESLGKPGQAATYFQTPNHMGGFSIDFPRLYPRLDWVICGGESGKRARPMHPDWARSLRDQCAAAEVPFFFKQWGEWLPVLDRDRDDPDWRSDYTTLRAQGRAIINLNGGMGFHGERVHVVERVGKKKAGCLLDGRAYHEFPVVGI